jgi:hypothetical protein
VQDSTFPDVFSSGKESLGEVLDNLSEFIEVDSPPADPGVVGKPEFKDGFPVGGVLRLYRNTFYGSSGHNDLVDITAGKWGVTPVLDVQGNHFRGPTGDEHIDLNGDAYIAGNLFENCTKDQYTSDRGYANAISSDAGGPETTVVVARNIFTRCDHAVNVKRRSAVIFEHNTVVDMNADYLFQRGTFSQAVKTSAINFYIPDDGGLAGDGAYMGYNIFYGQTGGGQLSRVMSWADLDLPTQPDRTTKVEMTQNFIDGGVVDPVIGAQHPAGVLDAIWQTRIGDPLFTDRVGANFSLQPTSPARGTARYGFDYGASIPDGCYMAEKPPIATPDRSAQFTIGGPGVFAFQWRVNGGEWSAPISIADGVFPRSGPTVRTAPLVLSGLADGTYTVDVAGQDFAGNWQAGAASHTWVVTSNPPTTYPEWLAWHRTLGNDDPDGDGLSGLTEYALGTDPRAPTAAPAFAPDQRGALQMRLPIERSGVTYEIESSATLVNPSWSPIAVKTPTTAWTGPVTVVTENTTTVRLTLSPTLAQDQRRFFRLRVGWSQP